VTRFSALRSRVPQLDTSSPDKLRRDLGRVQGDLDQLLFAIQQSFVPRMQFGRRITANTERASCRLNFSEAPLVDTRDGSVRLYLPKATPKQAGLSCGFIKQIATSRIVLQPAAGALINGQSQWDALGQVGFHYVVWDGTSWWVREPTERVKRHALAPGTVGLWQMDTTDIEDSSGNGFDLTVETGTERYTYISGTLGGFYFDGSTALWYDVSESTLRLLGDMTFECLILLQAYTNGAYFFSHLAVGELEAENQLYGLSFTAAGAPALQWLHEHDAGLNELYTGTNSFMALHQLSHLAVTRVGGVVTTYLNGRIWGAPSAALAAPTGGSSGRFRLGGNNSTRITGVMTSAKLMSRGLSAAEIMAERNYCLGGAQGYIDDF